MKQGVPICTASPFLELVVRRALARSSYLEPSVVERGAVDALAVLRRTAGVVVVDAELLTDGFGGEALRDELGERRAPTVVIDARGRGVPDKVTAAVLVVRGRVSGELDLETVEAELLAVMGSALRRSSSESGAQPALPRAHPETKEEGLELIVIGVSTGGPALLLRLFEEVNAPAIPLLIVQHMPESETASFAARLTEHTGLAVQEVIAGPLPAAGVIGVIRGGGDVCLLRRGPALHARGTILHHNVFHPNIDEVLASAATADIAAGVVILTGMGRDGAAGALALARKGCPVVAQRPDTCVVSGMPQAVIDNGAARWVQSPEAIAATLNSWSKAAARARRTGVTHCLE